ncbi:MAG: hypothetical protein JRJ20_09180 [Deltaproteobacteria bacterium]|nr:hypothetical protein [Deltaproteobacteria bacterium]
MKCPKCNYISFDYSQTCPKCKKALAEVREKMNLPSFKPTSPSLADFNRHAPTESIKMEKKTSFDMEETTEMDFSDSQDFDFHPEFDSAEKTATSDMNLSLDDVSDELSLGFDDFPMDDEASVMPQKEHTAIAEDSFETDLDFSFDDESDELSLDFDEPATGQDASEVLQTEKETGMEDSLDATLDLSFKEEIDEPIQAPEEPVTTDAETAESQGEEKTDEEDTEQSVFLEPSEQDEVTAAFDFGDLSMDEQGTDIEGKIADEEDDQLSLDLEESVSPVQENADITDSFSNIKKEQGGNISSDLEVLDLDLDLEQPDDK